MWNLNFLHPDTGETAAHLQSDTPIPVTFSEPAAIIHGSCVQVTAFVSGVGDVVQVLQRQSARDQARIWIDAAPVQPVRVNVSRDALSGPNPQGVDIAVAGQIIEWRAQEPLYAIVIPGAGAVNTVLNVMDFVGETR